ncbi:MAG TPA: PEP-CTERM sorting domain-containing protein, partial [Gemmatales bacterium]|nr:PEP-CTERM sorting domain-containing protein [Gemmatales bacterium]
MTNTNTRNYLTWSRALVACVVLLVVSAHAANAASIQLFNTGVDGFGALLPNSTVDPHYSLISSPAPFTTAYAGNGFNDVQWLADGPNSRWLGVSTWLAEWRPTGTYTYRTTFDLSGMSPTTATINISIASDNTCDVYLNGAHTGITTPFEGFRAFTSYTITSGFASGLNTLDFSVYEPGSTPSGLRVEMTGYASAVPEPTVLAMIGIGGFLFFGRFRK